jgi:hypothetical protein
LMTIRGLFEFNLDPINWWSGTLDRNCKNSKQVPCLMDPSAKKHMKTWRLPWTGIGSNSGRRRRSKTFSKKTWMETLEIARYQTSCLWTFWSFD